MNDNEFGYIRITDVNTNNCNRYVVMDDGIYYTDYTGVSSGVMPKETFVEAYYKYIVNDDGK